MLTQTSRIKPIAPKYLYLSTPQVLPPCGECSEVSNVFWILYESGSSLIFKFGL